MNPWIFSIAYFFVLAGNSCYLFISILFKNCLGRSFDLAYFFLVQNYGNFLDWKLKQALLLWRFLADYSFENIVFISDFRKNPSKKVLHYSSSPCWLLLTGAPHFSTLHTTTTTTLLSKIASCLLLQLTSKSLLYFALLPK